MELSTQIDLGFSQMKAAILGGHNLIDAWVELCQMVNSSKAPHAVDGGLGCLLICVEAVERAGLLPEVESPQWSEFLHGGHAHRVSICSKALKVKDYATAGRLVSVLALCIDQHCSKISFKGKVPMLS
ncbi:MAG: hypothetical protein JWR74_2773 [Polaromonas sp.]|nr:hypothetical protein [Polaromonas sp.]